MPQSGAAECVCAYGFQLCAESEFFQRRAALERTLSDGCGAVGAGHGGEGGAACETPVRHGGALGEGDSLKRRALRERSFAERCGRGSHRCGAQLCASGKSAGSYAAHCFREGYFRDGRPGHGEVSDGGKRWRQGDGRYACACKDEMRQGGGFEAVQAVERLAAVGAYGGRGDVERGERCHFRGYEREVRRVDGAFDAQCGHGGRCGHRVAQRAGRHTHRQGRCRKRCRSKNEE